MLQTSKMTKRLLYRCAHTCWWWINRLNLISTTLLLLTILIPVEAVSMYLGFLRVAESWENIVADEQGKWLDGFCKLFEHKHQPAEIRLMKMKPLTCSALSLLFSTSTMCLYSSSLCLTSAPWASSCSTSVMATTAKMRLRRKKQPGKKMSTKMLKLDLPAACSVYKGTDRWEIQIRQPVYWEEYVCGSQWLTDQLHQAFPVVPHHESEQWQQRPKKRVIAGISIVRVASFSHTDKTLRTAPEHIIIFVIITVQYSVQFN